jgi:hypothetical protein
MAALRRLPSEIVCHHADAVPDPESLGDDPGKAKGKGRAAVPPATGAAAAVIRLDARRIPWMGRRAPADRVRRVPSAG